MRILFHNFPGALYVPRVHSLSFGIIRWWSIIVVLDYITVFFANNSPPFGTGPRTTSQVPETEQFFRYTSKFGWGGATGGCSSSGVHRRKDTDVTFKDTGTSLLRQVLYECIKKGVAAWYKIMRTQMIPHSQYHGCWWPGDVRSHQQLWYWIFQRQHQVIHFISFWF